VKPHFGACGVPFIKMIIGEELRMLSILGCHFDRSFSKVSLNLSASVASLSRTSAGVVSEDSFANIFLSVCVKRTAGTVSTSYFLKVSGHFSAAKLNTFVLSCCPNVLRRLLSFCTYLFDSGLAYE